MKLPFGAKGAKKESEPAYYSSPLGTQVKNYNVYIMDRNEKLLVSLGLFVIGAAVAYIFYGGLFKVEGIATMATHISNIVIMGGIGLLSVAAFTPVWIGWRLTQQKKQLRSQFRDFLESFVASLSSGKNVTDAIGESIGDLKLQYGDASFICRELVEMQQAERNNIHLEVMLKSLGDRSGIDDIADFGDVFEICYRQGANLKNVARKTYSIINDKMAIEDEIQTKLTSNKMQFYVMMVMPVVVVAMLRFTNETFANNFSTPSGVMAVSIGIVCIIVAFLLGRKITDIKG